MPKHQGDGSQESIKDSGEGDPEDENRSPATLWHTMRRIIVFSYPYRYRMLTGLCLTLLATLVWLVIPLGVRSLLDAVFHEGNRDLLDRLAVGLLLLFVFSSLISFGSHYQIEWVGERVVTDLRQTVYTHLHKLGLRFFADHRLGELTSRLTNDVGAVRQAVTRVLIDLLMHGFSLLGSIALMVLLNWRLSIVIFVTIPIVMLISRQLGVKIRVLSRSVQDRLAETTAVAEEALTGIRVVKAFARESYETTRYTNATEDLFNTARKRVVVTAVFSSIIGMLFLFAMVTIFWFGGIEVLEGRLTTGDLVAFIFYAFNIARSVAGISGLYSTVNSAAGASERLFELLETEAEIADSTTAISLASIEGGIAFEHVSFHYEPGTPVLENVSFSIPPGETFAVVGPSGAGKTTLTHLIPRFFDTQSGCVSVDGHDVKELLIKDLREQIGLVAQDVHLFSDSVRENIRYGRLEATDQEIEEAAEMANAIDFINRLPGRFNARVGEKGVKLSGGERQRIAIARALPKNPRILLLDEATSSLDSESEALVHQAMSQLRMGRTTLIVAHRLSTVRHADRILVLDKGRIKESGTHDELLAGKGLYRTYVDMQFRRSDSSQDDFAFLPDRLEEQEL
ncbi:MAG: ABC transporter ATP-binding protein [Candidatus Latescibacteria bacterium]|nr:ABC transporter ATP-binding protein [Candidatus Latescibacterota bacterium]